MAVEKEEKYEYSGVWVTSSLENYPATIGKSHLQEYVSNYTFTKDESGALDFLKEAKFRIPVTTEQMQHANQDQSFHY